MRLHDPVMVAAVANATELAQHQWGEPGVIYARLRLDGESVVIEGGPLEKTWAEKISAVLRERAAA